MAETYKVTQYVGADDKYEFTPSDGEAMWLVPHMVLLEGPDAPNATVTVNRREDGEVPREGEELVGEIIQGKHGYRFKRDTSAFTSSNGQPDKYDRRPDHPTVEARAKHSTAIGATPRYIEQMLTLNIGDTPKDWDSYWALVETTIAKLEATYPSVGE